MDLMLMFVLGVFTLNLILIGYCAYREEVYRREHRNRHGGGR